MPTSNADLQRPDSPEVEEDVLLDAAEAAEEIPQIEDEDHPMDSDPEENLEDEVQLQNDSVAHLDQHKDSIFSIAQHPIDPSIVATGGGDDITYVWSHPTSSAISPPEHSDVTRERSSIQPLAKLTGHTDSINALNFSLPSADYLLTGGLDGALHVYSTKSSSYPLVASTQEVPEINFLVPCPNPNYPDTFALGASDGSVWVYTLIAGERETSLQTLQAYYLHVESCTAGAWTPDGNLLATVAEDGTFYVWDPFGTAAAQGITSKAGGQAVVGLTPEDQRFSIEGGLFSVAIAPSGAFAVVGGAGGMMRAVGLPRIGAQGLQGTRGGGAKSKAGGSKKSGGAPSASDGGAGQAGQILASLQAQGDGIETLAFSEPPLALLAAGSVDGTIVLFDFAHRWAVRRHI